MQNRGWKMQRMQGSIYRGRWKCFSIWVMPDVFKLIIIMIAVLFGSPIQSQQNDMDIQREQSNHSNNPHWKKNKCGVCHSQTPMKGKLYLRNNDVEKLCNSCHVKISNHSYIHPSNIKPSNSMLKRMPKLYRNEIKKHNGKVTCTTCHALIKQCLDITNNSKRRDTLFFRGGPYKSRSDICFNCHNSKAYVRMNPHDQINKQGNIRHERCQVCHRNSIGLKGENPAVEVDFNIKGDLSAMCTGCHPWKPHPGGSFSFGNKEPPNHLVIPSTRVVKQMRAQLKRNNIKMQLDPNTGRVYCATCHNPHEKDVIKNPAAAKGADSKNRLRTTKLCEQCHDK